MKIWVLSDLHLEYCGLREPLAIPEAVDVCVMAGDLMRLPVNGIHWLAENIAHTMPCVYVAGNHEFYRGSVREGLEDAKAISSQFPNVHFLENDAIEINSVRFIGMTLWTDYALDGYPSMSMQIAGSMMNDHREIALQRNPWMRFRPQDALEIHQASIAFLEAEISKPFDGKTVIISHHLPSAKSINPRFHGDALNPAFASDLSDLIEEHQPDLWVHGHTHDSCDYMIGTTRVVCNPRGYDDENPKFNSAFVVEI
ncbi:phosphatase [Paraburkholderia aspalathi]|nr:phosphatase [Paraburkholderia aspalathi]